MSSIIIVTGRVTADPVMQQAKNSGTEYISLGLATNQRGQSGKEEPIFYQCYCNKFLADRLIKAGVKKINVSHGLRRFRTPSVYSPERQ